MKTRVIAGICMLPLLLILYWGSYPLIAFVAFVAYMGVTEFYNGWQNIGVKPSYKIAYVMITLLYIVHVIVYMKGNGENMIFYLPFWLIISIGVSMMYGWKVDERGPYDAMATVLGLVYVVFFSYFILILDIIEHDLIWIVLLASFGSDIFAYFTGYLIGKHKLAPVLSPKKTIEGAIGGVIGAAVLCLLFAGFTNGWASGVLVRYTILGLLAGGVSQCGDLTASAFKRKMGIKDYGNLIPGHGGIMDRFDSVIFTAPFVYCLSMGFVYLVAGIVETL